jgi:hypothetical protein
MPELDPFEARLEAAVHSMADRARTDVDAFATARAVVEAPGRRPRTGWLGSPLPMPAYLVIVAGLLLAGTAWFLGGLRPHLGTVVAPPAPTATSAPALSPAPMPTPGIRSDARVAGSEQLVLVAAPTMTQVGSVQELRGGEASVTTQTDDSRTTGVGTWAFSSDRSDQVGFEWGTYRLENAGGSWAGTCRGGTWDEGTGAARSCWLSGGGDYTGLTFYFTVTRTAQGSGAIEGIIHQGSPGEP